MVNIWYMRCGSIWDRALQDLAVRVEAEGELCMN